ncbi:CMRF35-like molecule 8 isoform X1 [Amia ocellicauda]|uniref:CMRF35-like molecule 8 isoform X1 n=1 Tax=Amia ocellicauda TaxID=2972642 RepID=UPI003463E5CD
MECSYEQGHATLPKVWCKQNSSLCCSGFATANLEESLHEGQVVIRVQPERLSFTVSVTHLPEGPGVYWCGVLQPNNTIIKLREQTFSTSLSPLEMAWRIGRWLIFLLLLLSVIVSCLYSHCNSGKEKAESWDPDDGFRMTPPQKHSSRRQRVDMY